MENFKFQLQLEKYKSKQEKFNTDYFKIRKY